MTASDTRTVAEPPVVGKADETAPAELVRLVERTRSFTGAVGRADLARRLDDTRSRLLDPHVRVIVVGQFKQGKSKIVNEIGRAHV